MNPKRKRLVRIVCFVMAALMVLSIAYMTFYLLFAGIWFNYNRQAVWPRYTHLPDVLEDRCRSVAKLLVSFLVYIEKKNAKACLPWRLCRHWPIFPVRLQTSIVGTAELNFRVRNGNGWTLCVKSTDYIILMKKTFIENRTKRNMCRKKLKYCWFELNKQSLFGSSSPRSISIDQLNTLLYLHIRPIKLVVYKWP